MNKLFGIPMGALAVVLLAGRGSCSVALAVVALRNRVFFRLGVRNVAPPAGAQRADRRRA